MINNAYAEGWAVYAEALGKEIGFFQDPGSDYGRLSLELMRAVRLVVDTGIHAEGWTRDEAGAYFREIGQMSLRSRLKLTGILHGPLRASVTR